MAEPPPPSLATAAGQRDGFGSGLRTGRSSSHSREVETGFGDTLSPEPVRSAVSNPLVGASGFATIESTDRLSDQASWPVRPARARPQARIQTQGLRETRLAAPVSTAPVSTALVSAALVSAALLSGCATFGTGTSDGSASNLAERGGSAEAGAVETSTPSSLLRMEVIGADHAWLARYPGPDGKLRTADDTAALGVVGVPAGQDVQISLSSIDYAYLFRIPDLEVNELAAALADSSVELRGLEPGAHRIAGDTMCGEPRGDLDADLLVLPPSAFEEWSASLSSWADLQPDDRAAEDAQGISSPTSPSPIAWQSAQYPGSAGPSAPIVPAPLDCRPRSFRSRSFRLRSILGRARSDCARPLAPIVPVSILPAPLESWPRSVGLDPRPRLL